MEEELPGGIANAGQVARDGAYVIRPANPHSASIHSFLSELRASGFEGASAPVGIDDDGRERLIFIEGEVPVPPYPVWAQSDAALQSIAVLLREFHQSSASFDPDGSTWSREMADQSPGPIICHNDVCLENVVFRDGAAVGLLDFDFAAPGRPTYDLAQFARMCVPIDDDLSASRLGWVSPDRPRRLRVVADAYGLPVAARQELLEFLADSMAHGGQFVRRRVEAGDPNFTKMWNQIGGMERYDRRHRWWMEHQQRFIDALH